MPLLTLLLALVACGGPSREEQLGAEAEAKATTWAKAYCACLDDTVLASEMWDATTIPPRLEACTDSFYIQRTKQREHLLGEGHQQALERMDKAWSDAATPCEKAFEERALKSGQ